MIRRMCRVLVGDPGAVFRTSGKRIRARARALIVRPKPFVYVKAAYTREGSRMRAGSLQMLNPRARQVLRKREERTSARSPRVPAHARSFEIRVFRIHARSLHARAHFRMIACFRNANKTM